MGHQLQEKKSGEDMGKAVMQLLQIKYILAGMLALAVFGHTGDWQFDLVILLGTFSSVYTVETLCFWLPGSVSRIAPVPRRWKAAAAERDRRLRALLRDVERAEGKVEIRRE